MVLEWVGLAAKRAMENQSDNMGGHHFKGRANQPPRQMQLGSSGFVRNSDAGSKSGRT